MQQQLPMEAPAKLQQDSYWGCGVPVAIDYDTTTGDLDDEETISKALNQSFEINIVFPVNCTLKQAVLPDFIEPTNATILADYFSEATRKLNLQDTMDLMDLLGECTDSDPETPAYDTLRTCPLDLTVIDDGIIGSEEDTFSVAVTCPDEVVYTIKTFTLQKEADNDIVITII